MSAVFGVDVGGTKVAAAVIDGTAVGERVEHPTELSDGDSLLAGVEAAVGELSSRVGDPVGVGVGMPSQIDFATGTVVSSVNIPLAGVPLRQELGERFGAPVVVDNDANCAALAEAHLVPDPPAGVLVMLTLGTGVGGGVVIGGRIFRGATGLGAELGHVALDAGQDDGSAGFPRPGTLEWLCSGTGLAREASRRAQAHPDSALGRVLAERGRVTGRDAEDAARGGDAEALACFERYGRWLGIGIAGVVNTFEPERVVIGGGVSRAAELFMDTARAEAGRWALPALWERSRLELARGGADAGVIGAGLLATQELTLRYGRPDTGDSGSRAYGTS